VTRGDIVVVATRGASASKPRPALVVQSDLYNSTHASITICPVTSDLVDAPLFRIPLPQGARTGLKTASHVMVDKIVSVPRELAGRAVGRCLQQEVDAVDEALRTWLALSR
jgi:mRNA interferase MazF